MAQNDFKFRNYTKSPYKNANTMHKAISWANEDVEYVDLPYGTDILNISCFPSVTRSISVEMPDNEFKGYQVALHFTLRKKGALQDRNYDSRGYVSAAFHRIGPNDKPISNFDIWPVPSSNIKAGKEGTVALYQSFHEGAQQALELFKSFINAHHIRIDLLGVTQPVIMQDKSLILPIRIGKAGAHHNKTVTYVEFFADGSYVLIDKFDTEDNIFEIKGEKFLLDHNKTAGLCTAVLRGTDAPEQALKAIKSGKLGHKGRKALEGWYFENQLGTGLPYPVYQVNPSYQIAHEAFTKGCPQKARKLLHTFTKLIYLNWWRILDKPIEPENSQAFANIFMHQNHNELDQKKLFVNSVRDAIKMNNAGAFVGKEASSLLNVAIRMFYSIFNQQFDYEWLDWKEPSLRNYHPHRQQQKVTPHIEIFKMSIDEIDPVTEVQMLRFLFKGLALQGNAGDMEAFKTLMSQLMEMPNKPKAMAG